LSTNGGQSFSKTLNGTTFSDIEISANGTVYVTSSDLKMLDGSPRVNNKKVYKYQNGTWTHLSGAGGRSWLEVAVNGNQVWVADRGVSRIMYSNDGGNNWSNFGFQQNQNEIGYLDESNQTDWVSLGELEYNQGTNTLWWSIGDRVEELLNPTSNPIQTASRSRGIGELVSYDLAVTGNGNVLSAHADKGIIRSTIDGPGDTKFPNYFVAAWDISRCEGTPSFLTVNIQPQPWNPQGSPFNGYTSNNGTSYTPFPSATPDPTPGNKANIGRMAIASGDINNILWFPVNGNGQLYYTTNKGQSWQQSNYSAGLPNGRPAREFSSSRWIMADPVANHTFYLFSGEGGFDNTHIYKSTNKGQSWNKVSSSPLPWGFHAKMKVVPGQQGHLWYTTGREFETNPDAELRRSTNGGASWSVINGTSEVVAIAVGKAQANSNYPTIFIQGKVNNQTGLYSSYDEGQSWNKLADYPMDVWEQITEMVGDMDRFGNVYGTFAGHSPWAAQYSGGGGGPTTYTLNVSANNGSVSKSPNQANYNAGTNVTLTATADPGYQFSGWSGDASGSTNPLSITMNSNRNITANFSPVSGGGSCGQTLPGILNVEHCEPMNGATFSQGTPIVIKPNFTSDIVKVNAWYDGWNGIGNSNSSPFEITFNNAPVGTYILRIRGENASGTKTARKDITITVSSGGGPTTYTLTTSATNGSVSKSPNQANYNAGTNVTLTATADPGFQFSNWSGDASGSTNPLTITMNSNQNITANFSPVAGGGSCGQLLPGSLDVEHCDPADGATFSQGTPIVIKPNFTSDIVNVRAWYDGWNGIGASNAAPFEITFNNAPVGTYLLRIRGENASGTRTARKDITITVSSGARMMGASTATSSEVKLYPNPVKDHLFVEGEQASYEMKLFNLHGQQVFHGQIKPDAGLNISSLGLAPGSYTARLESGSQWSIHRLLIQ
ncbi:MAG: T9SS type A sorting domain-containing protein, partial [Bacteroidota bacterium]